MESTSSSEDVDILTEFTPNLKPKRKWKRRSNLALGQSKQKRKRKRQPQLQVYIPAKKVKRTQSRKCERVESTEIDTLQSAADEITHTDALQSQGDEILTHTVDVQSQPEEILTEIVDGTAQSNERSYLTYRDRCLQTLQDSNLLSNIIDNFEKEDLLMHFMAFMTGIASGTLSPTNMAILLAMEVAFLYSLDTTTQMRYREDTCLFWEVALQVGGPRLLRLFSSDKHFGQVNSNDSARSKYHPSTGSFNFAVPDERILRKSKTSIPKELQCGPIYQAFPLLSNSKEYVLSLDGKQAGPGLKGEGQGDINLWGFEGPPTLEENLRRLKEEIDRINNVHSAVANNMNILSDVVAELKFIVQISSVRIKGLRESKVRHEILRNSFQKKIKKFPDQGSRYQMAFSEIDAFNIAADKAIKDLLEINVEWCRIMAYINDNEHCFNSESPIILDNQLNSWILLTPDVINDAEYLSTFPQFIKQRTPEWHSLRQEGRVTGSTLHDALGLRSLKHQRQHFDNFILHKRTEREDSDLPAPLLHGQKHEINALGTLLGVILPAFTPRCHRFVEIGSALISHNDHDNFMVISPDGTIECVDDCREDQSCRNILQLPLSPLAVEFKCPYSPIENKMLLPVQYSPPHYYGCQLLSELVATKRSILWFCSCSPESLALSFVDLDSAVWDKVWSSAVHFYGGDINELSKPKSLNPESVELRQILKQYVNEKSMFALEVPTLKCIDTERYANKRMQVEEAFRHRDQYPSKDTSSDRVQYINECIIDACERTVTLVERAHDLQRRKATELLLFVVTDTDREFNKDVPISIPIAFALKGKSIRLTTARKMVDKIRDELKSQGTPILVECYDGQWSGLVFRDHENRPLTLFELQRDCWNEFARMSKDRMIAFVDSLSRLSEANVEEWSEITFINLGEFRIGNLEVTMDTHDPHSTSSQRYLTVQSYCGPMEARGCLSLLATPSQKSRPDLWQYSVGLTYNLMYILGYTPLPSEMQPRQEEDEDSDHDSFIDELQHDLLDVDPNEYLPDIPMETFNSMTTHEQICQHLLLKGKHILENILLNLLCSKRADKWQAFTIDELLTKVLKSTQQIYNFCTSDEINIIFNVLKKYEVPSCPLTVNLSANKKHKCNQLGFLLGHLDRVQPPPLRVKMRPLRDLAVLCIQREVPIDVIRVALASWKFKLDLHNWMDRSTVPISYEIPVPPFDFDLFSYPEFMEDRDQIEARIIDPSHCLTNLRLHATQKGFFGCDKNAFMRVSKKNNDLLNRALLEEPIPDKQSVPLARKIFSQEVEYAMMKNGDLHEADMVRHVRHWYDACNERALSVSTRIKYLVNMHNFMLHHYNAEHFPMNTTHVKGLPSTTFQAILQNVSTRIQLYGLSKFKTYNHRSVSTLAVESLFSDLNTLAKNSGGIPMATQIPRYVAQMTQLNAAKSNPTKPFAMRLTKKTNYPSYTADIGTDVVMQAPNGQVLYRTHEFDKPELKVRVKKWRKDNINFGNAPLRGLLPLRRLYYRINEAKIPATTRMGYPK